MSGRAVWWIFAQAHVQKANMRIGWSTSLNTLGLELLSLIHPKRQHCLLPQLSPPRPHHYVISLLFY